MKIEDKQLTFSKTLEVKYSGKLINETDSEITIEGEDEDSYFKVYSPFRGIAQLFFFENGRWVNAESGSSNFDFSSLGLGDPSAFAEALNMKEGADEIVDGEIVEAESDDVEEAIIIDEESKDTEVANAVTEETADEKSQTNEENMESETQENTPEIVEEGLPIVCIETEKGDIRLELFEDDAPNTVGSFISLIEGQFYDGLNFHRVISNFMIQGGCPEGTGTGGPGYRFADEISDKLHDDAGILSMANAGPNTNGSQFFITHGPTPHLDGKHAVFGKVIEGLDVVNAIQQGDQIKRIIVQQKRSHPYTVEKL